MNKVFSRLSLSALRLLSYTPLPVLYGFANVISFLFNHVLSYRKEVIRTNIANSFPNRSEAERKQIMNDFYHHLADLIVEGIKSYSISGEEVSKRFPLYNLNILDAYREKGESVIVVFGHYGNWEWLGLASSLQIHPQTVSLYRKIKNPVFQTFIKENRERFGMQFIAEREAIRGVTKAIKTTAHWSLVAFLADQAITPKRAFWIDFLHQKTTFVKGPEQFARRLKCPVVFMDVKKRSRGFYEGYFEELVPDPSLLQEGELMKKFANRLEKQIETEPAFWLWSHKRWKHKYDAE